MNIGVIGLDFSKLGLRVSDACMALTTSEFTPIHSQVVLLKTCHRFELFFAAEDLTKVSVNLLHHLSQLLALDSSEPLYSLFGYDCFFHLAKVVSGIDSRVFGEDEILRQVKVAYERDKKGAKLDFALHFLFQKCLKLGKEIRSTVGPRSRSPGLPSAIFTLLQTHFTSIKGVKVLLIGNSMINRKVYGHLAYHYNLGMHIATKGPLQRSKLPLIAYTPELYEVGYDVIIAGSHVTKPLIGKQEMQKLKEGTVLIDLGVPRNIDPQIISHGPLYSLEQVEKKQEAHPHQEQTAEQVKTLLRPLVSRYVMIYKEKMRKKTEGCFAAKA